MRRWDALDECGIASCWVHAIVTLNALGKARIAFRWLFTVACFARETLVLGVDLIFPWGYIYMYYMLEC
jgi:hypothetical protein